MINLVLDSRQRLALLEAVVYVQKFSQRRLYALPDCSEVTEAEARVASARSVSCATAPSMCNATSRLVQMAGEGLLARITNRFGWYPSQNCPVVVYQVNDAGRGYLQGLRDAEGVQDSLAPIEAKPAPPISRLRLPDYFQHDVVRATRRKSRNVFWFDVFWREADPGKFPALGPSEFWEWVTSIGAYRWLLASCKCGKPLTVSLGPYWMHLNCKNCNLWMTWNSVPQKKPTVRVEV